MDILAGILLIIAGILNFFAGMAYVARGKMTSGAANFGESAVAAAEGVADSNGVVIEQKDAMSDGLSAAKKSGMRFKLLGLFLYLSTVVLLAGAIFLFQGSYGQFILAAGIIAIIAELSGVIASKFGVTNVPGLLAGALTIYVSLPLLA